MKYKKELQKHIKDVQADIDNIVEFIQEGHNDEDCYMELEKKELSLFTLQHHLKALEDVSIGDLYWFIDKYSKDGDTLKWKEFVGDDFDMSNSRNSNLFCDFNKVSWQLTHDSLIKKLKKYSSDYNNEQYATNYIFIKVDGVLSYKLVTCDCGSEYGYFNNTDELEKVMSIIGKKYLLNYLFKPTSNYTDKKQVQNETKTFIKEVGDVARLYAKGDKYKLMEDNK